VPAEATQRSPFREESGVKLVDRDHELALLEERFEKCARGAGSVVLITGTVASGKTELLDTFSRRVPARGALTLNAAASAAEVGLPFGAIEQLLVAAGVDPRPIDDMLADGSISRPQSRVPPTIERRTAEVLRWVCSTLLALSRKQPVVITVDDVHLCDPFSFQAIQYLVRRMRSARMLIVLTELACPVSAAPVFHADLVGQPHCTWVSLAPLTRAGVEGLLREQVGAQDAARLAEILQDSTGGNPLLVNAMAADKRATAAQSPAAPPTALIAGEAFGQAVIEYLYRCPPIYRVVLQAAAVLDAATSPLRISRLTGIDTGTAARTMTALRRGGLVSGNQFRNPMARTAILDNIDPAEATLLHRRAAEFLHADAATPMVLAPFLLAADATDLEWAAPTLRAAAEAALALGETVSAVECLRMAYRCDPGERERALITLTLARVHSRNDPRYAARHVDELLEAIDRGHITGRDALMVIRTILWYGRVDDALQSFAGILTGYDRSDPEFAADLGFTQAWISYIYPAQRMRASDLASSATIGATTSPEVYGAGVLRAVLTEGFDDSSVIKIEEVLHRTPLDDRSVSLLTTSLTALIYADEGERADGWCERLSRQPVARTAPTWLAIFAALRGAVAMRHGNPVGATDQVRAAFEIMPASSWGLAVGLPLSTMLFAATATGDYEEAERLLDQKIPETMFRSTFGLPYLHARGDFYLATGRSQAALDDFQACGRLMKAWQIDEPAFVPWRTGAAQALLRLGEVDIARRLAEDQLTLLPGGGSWTGGLHGKPSPARGLALRVKAATISGPQKLALIGEAVAILDTTGDRLELARALADLGQAQHELGALEESRTTIGRAWAVARECRAEALCRSLLPYLDSVETVGGMWLPTMPMLEPAPVPPAAGVDDPEWTEDANALSEAEHRVAELAARGLKNKEIARRLFITVSTVEQHLTRVYRKLEVTRRSELANRLLRAYEKRL
jgi:DNA-binding CsgD family transcriptional regulator